MFKKLRESKFLKGKLTYAGIAAIVLPLAGKFLGVEISEGDVGELVQAVGVIVAVYGRWRAIQA